MKGKHQVLEKIRVSQLRNMTQGNLPLYNMFPDIRSNSQKILPRPCCAIIGQGTHTEESMAVVTS